METSKPQGGLHPPLPEELITVLQNSGVRLTLEELQLLKEHIHGVVNYHATIGVMGKTGAGKSSLCNALFGCDIAETSAVEACTRTPQEIEWSLQEGKGLSLIDMPGVGESEVRDSEYAELYRQLLPELDLVLWVIKGDDRALSIDEHFYLQVLLPLIWDSTVPVMFVVSQVDKVEPCREWDWRKNHPGPCQGLNVTAKVEQVRRLFKLPESQVCAIAAEEGYGLAELVEKIVAILPNEKKWSFTREAKQENVSQQAWQSSSQGLWESITSAVKTVIKDSWDYVSSRFSSLATTMFRWW
ncbi:GTPase family protein [Vogesella indigofera]|uniref:GTPase family protein n=1 Tax=Vogesella indigofera TaxID=45465 RepID=UPI00234E9802|nr:GTPase [Vogesella indigofera]MDC7698320.1 50S ribosome-binding GTPase [Vogesella indigofera]